MRWSAPLRDALDAGFSDQALQYRLRAQADKLWARRQQALWRESLEQILARHEACMLAEVRLLLRAAAQPSGALAHAAPVRRPASEASPPHPRAAASSQRVVEAVALKTSLNAALTDAEIDALPPELPPAASAGVRRRPLAGNPATSFKPI